MSSLTVELPESLRKFVEAQAAERGLGAASDYLVALADEARSRAAKARLEAHLLASLRSGPPIEVTDEYWDEELRQIDAWDRCEDQP